MNKRGNSSNNPVVLHIIHHAIKIVFPKKPLQLWNDDEEANNQSNCAIGIKNQNNQQKDANSFNNPMK